MAGSPKKRARRAGLNPDTDWAARSGRVRRDAENAAANEITEWFSAERAKIRSDSTLTEAQRRVAERDLMLEFGRRSKRALAKAKRDSSPAKILEREALAELERRRNRPA